ncbi:MAG TPA: hypothetical protein VIL06_07280 [Coriobacteriia bacterium]
MEQPRTITRAHRSRRPARNIGRDRLVAAVAVLVLFMVGGAALALIAPGRQGGDAAKADVWSEVATDVPVAATPAATTPVAPTPVFASIRGADLRLPVPAASVTALAFHQSSYADTVVMKPLIAIADPAVLRRAADAAHAAVKAGGKATIRATPESGAEDAKGVWTGSALQLWRDSTGERMDSAVDCGAAPGTPVLAPVDGTVMEIRPYKLYKKYDDFEIHIKPDAWNDLDVIILHVTSPAITVGARVVGGVTRIASVRNLSKIVSGLQLRNYVLDGGNHTHVQVNTIPRPNETWALGEDPPGLVRH